MKIRQKENNDALDLDSNKFKFDLECVILKSISRSVKSVGRDKTDLGFEIFFQNAVYSRFSFRTVKSEIKFCSVTGRFVPGI